MEKKRNAPDLCFKALRTDVGLPEGTLQLLIKKSYVEDQIPHYKHETELS